VVHNRSGRQVDGRGLRSDRMTAEVEMAGGIDGIVAAARLTLN
jgi:hypothetical protein